jgi:formylglycine-generating enzyme required for sulfatase activity/nucleoside phosphorylase
MSQGPLDFAIVTALKVERDAVLRRLPSVEAVQEDDDLHTYYLAYLDLPGGRRYSVVLTMLTEPGNSVAAASATHIILRWQPRYVLLVGIAGGVAGRVGLGDIVVADFCYAYEQAKRRPSGDEPRGQQLASDRFLYGRALAFEDEHWKQAIGVAPPTPLASHAPAVHFGPIASGEKVIADLKTLPWLTEQVPKLLATEMEGAGVAKAASQQRPAPGFFEIRGISDFADDQKSDNWHAFAAHAAAAFTIGFLQTGPVKPLSNGPPVQTATDSQLIRDWVAKTPEPLTQVQGSIGLLHHIAAGPFSMGSSLHPREAPARSVFVGEFEIAHLPVTVSQYAAFLVSGGYQDARWWSEAGWAWRQGHATVWGRTDCSQPDDWMTQSSRPTNPVTGITWHEAEAYCRWLGAQKNRLVRLPTEEEWEKAARGTDSRLWPWGDTFGPKQANTYEYGAVDTLPVGHVADDVGPYGLQDMAGNVQAWTSSAYHPLAGEVFPDTDIRVARGGSWNDTAFGARAACRHAYPTGYFYPFLGFRIVVDRL